MHVDGFYPSYDKWIPWEIERHRFAPLGTRTGPGGWISAPPSGEKNIFGQCDQIKVYERYVTYILEPKKGIIK